MVTSGGNHILHEQIRELIQIKRFQMIRKLMSTIYICVHGNKASTNVHSKYDIVTGMIWKTDFQEN